jgi:hypothetical protein
MTRQTSICQETGFWSDMAFSVDSGPGSGNPFAGSTHKDLWKQTLGAMSFRGSVARSCLSCFDEMRRVPTTTSRTFKMRIYAVFTFVAEATERTRAWQSSPPYRDYSRSCQDDSRSLESGVFHSRYGTSTKVASCQ